MTHEFRASLSADHKVVPLDPFGLTEGKGGGFNPMDLVDLKSPACTEVAMSMSENVIRKSGKGEAHWIAEAKAALIGFILFTKSLPDPSKHNLGAVRELVHENHLRMQTTPEHSMRHLIKYSLRSKPRRIIV